MKTPTEDRGFFPAERLVAYGVAKEVLAQVAEVARCWRGFGELRAQAVAAAQSAVLNLAEGASQPRGSAAKRRHYDIALASTGEVAAALDCAGALHLSAPGDLATARRHCLRLASLLGGLVRATRG